MACSLTFFPTQTTQGLALRDAFEPLAHKLGFNVKVKKADPLNVLAAIQYDDVVVFDASIEGTQNNYTSPVEMLGRLKHALLVSRTPLPLNIPGQWEGSAPNYPDVWDNQKLLDWLERTLPQLSPRSFKEKLVPFLPAIFRSSDWHKQYLKEQGQIFISYRSRYSEEVAHLKRRINNGDFHEGEGKTVYFFPPAALAFEDELLTPMRRWLILCLIHYRVEACEEFWIYETDDYLDSWWTRGELARRYIGGSQDARKLRVFRHKDQTLRTLPPEEILTLTDKQSSRMARITANCDPTIMGPDTALIWRERLRNNQAKEFDETVGTLLRPLPTSWRNQLKGFASDSIWEDQFWEYPVMQCSSKQCVKEGRVIDSNVNTFAFDIDAFIAMQGHGLFQIKPEALQEALHNGDGIACPHCGKTYIIIRELKDRYLAYARPLSKDKESVYLAVQPVYRFLRK